MTLKTKVKTRSSLINSETKTPTNRMIKRFIEVSCLAGLAGFEPTG